MARSGVEMLATAELVAPVPLHWRRLLVRRYNQAALLAWPLARLAGVPAVPDLLLRRRATRSEERRLWNACVSTCRSRGAAYQSNRKSIPFRLLHQHYIHHTRIKHTQNIVQQV